MNEINFEMEYESGIRVSIDWVAGGNFDGYVYKTSLKFIKENNQVVIKTKILNKSSYDGEIYDSETKGKFQITDHGTITCIFGEMNMRGKFLGERKEFIAFSIFYPKMNYPVNVCYEMKGY